MIEKLKNKKLYVFLLIIILFGGFLLIRQTPEEKWAKQTILAYIEAKGFDIRPGTDRYNIFLREVWHGEIPELTSPPSDFVKNDTEANYIRNYAAEKFQKSQKRPIETELPDFEAFPAPTDESK